MALVPLKQFICDRCGQVVELSEGVLVFDKDEKCRRYAFEIIHKARCDDGKKFSSVSLTNATGPNGLIRLLSFIHPGTQFSETQGFGIVDSVEFSELMRRLWVPYYEEARQYFEQVDDDYDMNEVRFFMADNLKRIIDEHSGR